MPAKCTILALLTFILVMSFNQWCKGLRDASNNVMNARRERQAPQPPPVPHTQSEAPLHDGASQPEFENLKPYELPVHHSPPPPLVHSSPPQRPSGLPNHKRQLPLRFQDELPALPIPVPIPPPVTDINHAASQSDVDATSPRSGTESDMESDEDVWVHTDQDTVCSTHTWELSRPDGPSEHKRSWYAGFGTAVDAVNRTFFAPFLNVMTFRLMMQEVILAEDFEREDLRGFSASREAKRMDQAGEDPNLGLFTSDKWREASVKIKLPAEKEKFVSEADAPEFEVKGLYYRKPLEVLKSAYEEMSSRTFHTTPFKVFWHPDEHEFPE
ncbi:uncharacterized protein F5147DRAFT_767335 [Suillus discolor]|uniref:Uncharacterized protein n=1 Tax=Suillus discolor TaxID=1912936 RepID=A0A9P7K0N8_9AGAM|nr:uncharacterized protein F5147DRAFT_767335 [Suillus discolor]KAG2119871.1 hypothetical protein F5147DRAFT_767335 [Suillus discolor]